MKEKKQEIINITRALLGVPIFIFIIYNDLNGNHIFGELLMAGGCLLTAGIILKTKWNNIING